MRRGERRERVLEAVAAYWAKHGLSPSYREIAEAAGLKSPSTVHFHLRALEAEGLVKLPEERRSCSVRLVEKAKA